MRRDLDLWRTGRGSIGPGFGLSDRLNRFLDEWSAPSYLNEELPSLFSPATDLDETETHYLVSMELPGISKDDIHIDVVGNQVRVFGERKSETGEPGRRRYFERSYGRFERLFSLPSNVDAEKVEANFRNGVLELAIPKTESAQSKRLKINESESFFSRYLGKVKEGVRELKNELKGEGKREKSGDKSGERAA